MLVSINYTTVPKMPALLKVANKNNRSLKVLKVKDTLHQIITNGGITLENVIGDTIVVKEHAIAMQKQVGREFAVC